MSWKKALSLPALFLILFAAVLALIWFAVRASPPAEPLAGLSETEITQRAIALAQNEYAGTPSDIAVEHTTIGETGIVECGAMGKALSLVTDSLRGRPNWCLPDTGVWVITLRGNFRQGGSGADTLTAVFDSSGRFMRLTGGALTQIDW